MHIMSTATRYPKSDKYSNDLSTIYWHWWDEFSRNDPRCKADLQGEAKIIQQDGGRWLTYGYVIARKPK